MKLDHASQVYYDEYVEKIKANNIKFVPINKTSFKYESMSVRGLFFEVSDDPDGYVAELHVAVKGKPTEWFPIFVHESSHMDQFLEDCIYWRKCVQPDGRDLLGVLDDFLNGKLTSKKDIIAGIRASIGVEWDCERRVLKKIKEYGLPINTKLYARRANGYLYTYAMLLQSKAWPKAGKSAYAQSKVYDEMPSKLLPLREYYVVPKRYRELFFRYCF